jgi:hypothetical protein
MSQAVADSVRGRCKVIAVSDCYKITPWADALVSQDRPWWMHHKEAQRFAGRKFTGSHWDSVDGVERVAFEGVIASGTNSALLACHVAVKIFEAKELILLGVDMQGSHFFGPHPEPLKNTLPRRFEEMKKQFARWPHKGVTVVNCTEGSALDCFPKMSLKDVIS